MDTALAIVAAAASLTGLALVAFGLAAMRAAEKSDRDEERELDGPERRARHDGGRRSRSSRRRTS